MWNKLLATTITLSCFVPALAQTGSRLKPDQVLPPGYWSLEQSQPIILKTQTIRLAPDLSHLSAGERQALAKLLEVGKIFQSIYEEQRHAQALSSHQALRDLHHSLRSPAQVATQNLLTLYRLNQGPTATTLANKREQFLPVEPTPPGKNVYQWGVGKEMIEKFLAAHPDKRAAIMASRPVVRRAQSLGLQRDLAALKKYPVLDTLHPGLKGELEELLTSITAAARSQSQRATQSSDFYAVPYSVAYPEELVKACTLRWESRAGRRQSAKGKTREDLSR